MKLIDAVHVDSIEVNLHSRTKDDLFEEMVALLKRNPVLADADAKTILRALNERERTATTGVGKEVAIPHGKLMGLGGIVGAIGVSRRGIDYGSIDGHPVRFVVAIVAPPEESRDYLRILAKVARVLSDPSFTESLVTASSPGDIHGRIRDMEEAASPVSTTEEQRMLLFELRDPDYFDAVVEYFTEVGATTATVLDARNVQGFLTRVPLFSDFARVFTEGQEFGHIFLLVIDRGAVKRFVDGLEDIVGDFAEEGRGIVVTFPIDFVRGRPTKIEL
ncbi:MAG: PTS sugar transporter subunit IIA [Candidatus Eisenbacteria bacterium]|nr:PTS sugar transporter subunit IIA [Candidatus Eisenbacteria bacterium]